MNRLKHMINRLIRKLNLSRTSTTEQNKSWSRIYQSTDPFAVEVTKLILEEAGIPFIVFDQRDSTYNAFGYIYIDVPVEYEESAKKSLILPHE